MNARTRMQLVAIFAAGTALFTAGCSDRSNETVGQKVDRTTDKMATSTERTADKMATSTERAADKTAAVIDDATITTKVKAAVLAEPGLKTLQINVDTKNGLVTLNGTVDTPQLKERAMQVAQSVEGVKSVSDQLVVKAS